MEASRKAVEQARQDTSGRIYRVYADGVFDLCHLGHAKMLEQAKNALGTERTYLLAGVCCDEDVHRYKGKTVMDHKTRMESVKYLKNVDEVLGDAPWVVTDAFLKKHNIDFVAHDAIPYAVDGDASSGEASSDVYAEIKKRGKFLETKRTEGISTSDLIVKLIREYDGYVKRNLKRGYSKDELNVGKSWEVRAEAHERKRKLKDAVTQTKHHFNQTKQLTNRNIKRFLKEYSLADFSGDDSESDTEELTTHTCGFFCGLLATICYFVSFLNPLAYTRSPEVKKMVGLGLFLGIIWNIGVFRLGQLY